MKKQQQLLSRLQTLVHDTNADSSTTHEVIDYFLKRLASTQAANRVLATKVFYSLQPYLQLLQCIYHLMLVAWSYGLEANLCKFVRSCFCHFRPKDCLELLLNMKRRKC